jgi:hypothetical protein
MQQHVCRQLLAKQNPNRQQLFAAAKGVEQGCTFLLPTPPMCVLLVTACCYPAQPLYVRKLQPCARTIADA